MDRDNFKTDLRLKTLNRTIWRLAWPAIVENMLFSTVLLADTLITGWLRDERMLAATALAGLLMFLMNAPFIALAAAANSIVSRSWGEGDYLTGQRCAGMALGLAVALAGVLCIGAEPFADIVVRLFGASSEVAPIGAKYLRILLLSGFCGFPMMVSNAVIRGTGNTYTPMRIAGLMNAVNVLFSVLLAFGWMGLPAMGVYGVAWGTVIARGVGFALSAGYLTRRGGTGVVPDYLICRDRRLLSRLWHQAWPTFAERFTNSLIYVLFMRLVAGLGTTTLAAHNITMQVESLAFMLAWAISTATTTLVGQAIGARLEHIAESTVHRTLTLAAILMGMLAAVFLIFGPQIVMLFGATEAVIGKAAVVIRIAAAELVFMAWTFVLIGAMRGAGDARSPMLVNFTSTLLFRIGGVYLLAYVWGWGLPGVWTATAVDWAVRSVGLALCFRRGRWKGLHEQEKLRFAAEPVG